GVGVVGPRWADEQNLPRLHDTSDMVRHELLSALADGTMALVPTLVEGAGLPVLGRLPLELRPLFDIWNARHVTEDGWEDDTRRLIGEIAEAAGLSVVIDLDELLRHATSVQHRFAELERVNQLQAGQLEDLQRSVDALRASLADAVSDRRKEIAGAFEALAQGESKPAEDTFESEYEARAGEGAHARRRAAEAARNVASLALLRDVTKAVA